MRIQEPSPAQSDRAAPWLSWFCVWQADQICPIDAGDLQKIDTLLRACGGVRAGHIMLPTHAHDPFYPSASGSPSLIVQLEFDDLALLEGHLRSNGHLAPLADAAFLGSMSAARPAHQAMLSRKYPVPDPAIRSADGGYVSYWVEYAGPAEDTNAWHVHYNRDHPRLLAGFPGIRAVEIYTPAVIVCELPLPERPCMQRNKTVFDTAAAMNAAMQSPVRQVLREDFHRLPAFQGASLHYPFMTQTWRSPALLRHQR